jgi:hypothetical protein
MKDSISVPGLAVTELRKDDILLITVPGDTSLEAVNALKAGMDAKFEGYPVRVTVITENEKLSVIRQPQA